METDLIRFNENLEEIKGSNNLMKYEDEKGNYTLIPLQYLYVGVQYLELDEAEFTKAKFNKQVNPNYKYNSIKITRPVDKSTITHNKKDQGTLVDKEIKVKQVYLVTNGIKCSSSFIDKDEAIKTAKELNERYLKIAELNK